MARVQWLKQMTKKLISICYIVCDWFYLAREIRFDLMFGSVWIVSCLLHLVSQAVTHLSTNLAGCCLTLVNGWELLHSAFYGHHFLQPFFSYSQSLNMLPTSFSLSAASLYTPSNLHLHSYSHSPNILLHISTLRRLLHVQLLLIILSLSQLSWTRTFSTSHTLYLLIA